MCTKSHRIPASASRNQGSEKGDLVQWGVRFQLRLHLRERHVFGGDAPRRLVKTLVGFEKV